MSKMNKQDVIILCGGRTGGPVFSMVPVYQKIKIKFPNLKLIIADINSSVAKKIMESEHNSDFIFESFYEAKLHRYFTLKNIFFPFQLVLNCFKAITLFRKYNVRQVYSSGGFISVPIMLMAKIWGITCHIHQQDVNIGLANKITRFFASSVSVCLPEHVQFFSKSIDINFKNSLPVEVTGNPVLLNEKEDELIKFPNNLPVLMFKGGATGSTFINSFIEKDLEKITKLANIIWITGHDYIDNGIFNNQVYKVKYADNVRTLYESSDLVIARAGLGTITDLMYLEKPAILVPMSNTHQEENVEYFTIKHCVFWRSSENGLNLELIREKLNSVLWKKDLVSIMKKNAQQFVYHDSETKIAEMIMKYGFRK